MAETVKELKKKAGKTLYGYQAAAIDNIFGRIEKYPDRYNLLFQLPTG